jgi:hypothetical protein
MLIFIIHYIPLTAKKNNTSAKTILREFYENQFHLHQRKFCKGKRCCGKKKIAGKKQQSI